jgi:gliding motility-associated-like protein
MKRLACFFVGVILCLSAKSQGITRAEYFFNNDPGPGNGINIPLGPTGDNISFTTSIAVGSLPPGFHMLGVRVKQSAGPWSIFESRGLYITNTIVNTPNITAAEYFIDTDPGQGNGTPVAVTTGPTTVFTFAVPTSGLVPGFHFLAVRTKSPGGRWSIFESRGFYLTTSTTNVSNIAAAEYFFDSDPGPGSGTAIPVTPGATTNFTVALPTTTLLPGFHFLGIRVKSSSGQWGLFEGRGFYISASVNNVPDIVSAEYFIDQDPGTGLGSPLAIPSGSNPTFTASIPTANLAPGFHFLAIRSRDAVGRWSGFESRGFYVVPGLIAGGDIVAAEYYVDTDPGPGNGIPVSIASPGTAINESLIIHLSGVASGVHTLGIRVQDSNGAWSEYLEDNFTVLVCTPPAPPVSASKSRCNKGPVTLEASGANPNQEYRWYDSEFGVTPLSTGASFTTSSLDGTTDFFVSVFDPVTLCESARTKAAAVIVPVEQPILNAAGVIQLCEETSFLLSAPEGFVSYQWSDGSQTRQVLVTSDAAYSVVVSTSTCTLPASDVVTFEFLAKPTTPQIVITGNTTICEAGEVTLSGPAGMTTYEWSTGETTESITVNNSGSYTLNVGNDAGCRSSSSAPVIINIFTAPDKPEISVTGLETICDDDFTVLSAPSGFALYEWSNGETTQTIVVRETSTLNVRVAPAASCFSVASDNITITQTGMPCSSTANPNNQPPTIAPIHTSVAIQESVVLTLLSFVSDGDGTDDIVSTSVRITMQPISGATATITSGQQLMINYNGSQFTGIDHLTIQVCDRSGSCTQGDVTIEVVSEIAGYNAVSPNNDGLNEFLLFEFIDIIPDALQNKVTIYNRWGSVVFETSDYNNNDRAFRGLDNEGNELPNGTYFYKVVFISGRPSKDGFITLRR